MSRVRPPFPAPTHRPGTREEAAVSPRPRRMRPGFGNSTGDLDPEGNGEPLPAESDVRGASLFGLDSVAQVFLGQCFDSRCLEAKCIEGRIVVEGTPLTGHPVENQRPGAFARD